jgi:hypothetical protein
MRLMFAPFMLASMISFSALAQSVAPQPVTVVAGTAGAPAKRPVVLPIMSEVMVTLDAEIDSGRVKVGDSFAVSVSRDVMIGNYVIIPRGTPGVGEIAAVTRKGGFGKSGKLEIDLRSLTLAGGSLPLSGHFQLIGRNNDTVTIGAVVAVGVLSRLVTGHSAVVSKGREFRGFTRASLPIAPAAD